MRELMAALRPVKRRLRLLRLTSALGWLLALAALAAVAWLAASFLLPIADVGRKILLSALPLLALGGALALLWPVPARLAAQRADRCGLQERAITALEGCGQGEMALLQRRDALAALKGLDVKRAMPVKWRRAPWIIAAGLCLAAAALCLLPNPQSQVLRERAEFAQKMAAQAAQMEKLAQSLTPSEPAAQTRELEALLRNLARSLKEAGDRREALSALDKAERELNSLRAPVEAALQAAAQALRQAGLEDVAQAMEGQRQGATSEAPEENLAQAAAAALSQAAAGQEATLAQALGSLAATALQSGQAASAQALGQALSAGLGSGQLGQAGSQLGALRQAALGGGMGGSGSGGAGGGAGEQPGGGSGGRGEGTGSGAGQGSTNLDGGRSGGGAGQRGVNQNQENQIKNGEYERIYDPSLLGGTGEMVTAQGQVRQGESMQVELGPGEGSLSGSVPYRQVIGDYAATETQSARYQALTPAQQTIVNRYYQELTK